MRDHEFQCWRMKGLYRVSSVVWSSDVVVKGKAVARQGVLGSTRMDTSAVLPFSLVLLLLLLHSSAPKQTSQYSPFFSESSAE